MAQFKFLLWLAHWYLTTQQFEFDWDFGNVAKNSVKHGILPEEVESVFRNKEATPVGIQISPSTIEERFCLIGISDEAKIITVIFALRESKVRTISARPASRKERRVFNAHSKTTKSLRKN